MDEFPSRPAQGNPAQVRRWMGEYYGRWVISGLGMLSFLWGGIGGAFVFAWFELNPILGLLVGMLLGGFAFDRLFRRTVQRWCSEQDAYEASIRNGREQEFERQLAEAKRSGDFDRFGG